MISKEKVRKKAVETRDSIDEESRQQKSEEIVKQILVADWFKEADIVLSYHAFRSEVEVDALNQAVLAQGKKLYLPKTYVKEKQIRFFEVTDLSKLRRGYQKIWEPTGEEPEFSFDCEFCALYYVDDDGYGECQVNLDEDEMYRFMNTSYRSCPYYQNDDEYKIVRKQN